MLTVFDKINVNLYDIGSANGRNLYVEFTIQKANVKVNEEGTESAGNNCINLLTISVPLPLYLRSSIYFYNSR